MIDCIYETLLRVGGHGFTTGIKTNIKALMEMLLNTENKTKEKDHGHGNRGVGECGVGVKKA
jgi:hypothetical protein